MVYYIGSRELKISDNELFNHYIDEGTEVEVYRFDDEVLKLYKTYCNKNRLDEKTINKLKNIDTKRIIMPNNVIRNESLEFIGYSMPYIESNSLDFFNYMTIQDLINELEIVKQDLIVLSKNQIDIEDINIGNILLGDGLYFIDPGSYNCSKYRENLVYSLNKYTVNLFVLKDILERYSKISKKDKKILKDIIPVDDEYIGDVLYYDHLPNLTIKEYVHTKIKSR